MYNYFQFEYASIYADFFITVIVYPLNTMTNKEWLSNTYSPIRWVYDAI